ncbi:hypothetical protein, partial [Paenibacillus darwinianus]|uniref:hypothetical protein n=1 Tax=Paenibacillus darwinianus TaxID=1380763 RepID=UPI001CBE7592
PALPSAAIRAAAAPALLSAVKRADQVGVPLVSTPVAANLPTGVKPVAATQATVPAHPQPEGAMPDPVHAAAAEEALAAVAQAVRAGVAEAVPVDAAGVPDNQTSKKTFLSSLRRRKVFLCKTYGPRREFWLTGKERN